MLDDQLIEGAPLGIYVVDAEFRLYSANAQARAVFGEGDWIGRDFGELIHSLWPNPYADELLERFRHTLVTGEPYVRREHTDRRVDRGRVEHYEWQIARVELGGRLAVVCYFNDISARVRMIEELERQREGLQESKARLELAQRATGVGMFDWDIINDRSEVSPEWRRIYGLPAPGPMPTHEDWRRCVHPEDLEGALESVQAAIASGAPYSREFRVIWPDGSVHWVVSGGKALYDATGTPVRVLGTAMDVTARKRAEAALHQAKSAAEAANQAKDDFLAVLSHELRTPLTPVLAAATLLECDARLAADQCLHVQMIRRNVELEARLIDDLLDVTRISRNKLELEICSVDVHESITRVIEMVRAEAGAKGVTIEERYAASAHHVRADAARLQQIVWNLLKNAVKFTPAGGSVSVATSAASAVPGSSEALELAVSDTGVGIRPDALPYIFDAFEQGGRDVTQRFGGLGLGLAISKALVQLHGGSISAASRGRGLGTTIRVRLPLAAAGETVHQRAPRRGPAALDCSVLLVEDHADTRAIMEAFFLGLGCAVKSAATAAEALELAARTPFSVVVSDIGLPDLSGTELMRTLHSRHGLKGIALSGYGMDRDVRKSREAGFDAHLIKPVNLDLLEQTLRELAARPGTDTPGAPPGASARASVQH
ncbi:MAG TPA: ATP-binding protein [Steroidobacteraceae bacterium]|nr:ATP-binding protein [Steroidobacteraceae bacterium]